MYSNVIVGITISRGSFVFSQSRVKVSTSLTNVGTLAVGAFDDANNHIAVHHQLTNHDIDWDSARCLTYSTNYFQRLTLESWYTNLEQTPLNGSQQLPPYRRLIHDRNETDERTSNRPTSQHGPKNETDNLTNNRRIETHQ